MTEVIYSEYPDHDTQRFYMSIYRLRSLGRAVDYTWVRILRNMYAHYVRAYAHERLVVVVNKGRSRNSRRRGYLRIPVHAAPTARTAPSSTPIKQIYFTEGSMTCLNAVHAMMEAATFVLAMWHDLCGETDV